MGYPTIVRQPTAVVIQSGDNVDFECRASVDDNTPVHYTWSRDGAVVSGLPFINDGNGGLSIVGATAAQAGLYYCDAVGTQGTVRSNTVSLTIGPPPPTFTQQPVAAVVALGGSATFTAAAAPLAGYTLLYQWARYKLNSLLEITGATDTTLTVNPVTQDDLGTYVCLVNYDGIPYGQASAYVTLTAPASTTDPTGTGGTGNPGTSPVTLPGGGTVPGTPGAPAIPTGGVGSPIFSGAASAFAAMFAESFGTVGVYPDGDFTVAMPDGMAWPEFPFAHEGDQATVVIKRRYWQYAKNFTPLPLGTGCPWNASLLLIGEDEFKLPGGGIVTWTRTYATLPASRNVYESTSYGFQYVVITTTTSSTQPTGGSGGSGSYSSSLSLKETAFEVSSRVLCEYYHVKDRANWPTLLAPRFVQLTDNTLNKRGQGNLSLVNYAAVSTDAEILAEDTKERLWEYPFMCRRSRYIAGPTAAFWGSAFNLPSASS